jgi:signal transduction histidine kinase
MIGDGVFWRSLPQLNLRTKATLAVALPLLLILGSFTAIEYGRHRQTILTNLSLLASHAGQVIELNLRHQMIEADLEGVQELLVEIGTREEFRNLYILAPTGEIIFASDPDAQGLVLDNRNSECQGCHSLVPAERPASIVTTSEGENVFRSMRPLENSPVCNECHETDERILGLLLTDIAIDPLEAPLTAHLRESVIWGVGAILVIIVVVNLALDRLMLRRLEELAANIARFGHGQDLPPPVTNARDEVGQLATAFHQMAEKVAARSNENQALSARLQRQNATRGQLLKRLITVQEDERKRIARELHDNLGQLLGGLALRLELIERLSASKPQQSLEQLYEAQTLVSQATNQMYELILELRPSSLDDLGLVAALHSHAQRTVNGSGIIVQFETSGLNGRLPAEIETALYRIFQEALNNVIRHAHARCVFVCLTRRDGHLIGEIRDDGRGFNPAALNSNDKSHGGFGLLGIQERVNQWGGRLEIVSRPGEGTVLTIDIPLAEPLPEINHEQ